LTQTRFWVRPQTEGMEDTPNWEGAEPEGVIKYTYDETEKNKSQKDKIQDIDSY